MARDIGSWLSGPEPVRPGGDTGYPGERLGLPETGSRSLARMGRRFGALIIDWLIIEEPEMGLHPQAVMVFMLLVLDLLWRGCAAFGRPRARRVPGPTGR